MESLREGDRERRIMCTCVRVREEIVLINISPDTKKMNEFSD